MRRCLKGSSASCNKGNKQAAEFCSIRRWMSASNWVTGAFWLLHYVRFVWMQRMWIWVCVQAELERVRSDSVYIHFSLTMVLWFSFSYFKEVINAFQSKKRESIRKMMLSSSWNGWICVPSISIESMNWNRRIHQNERTQSPHFRSPPCTRCTTYYNYKTNLIGTAPEINAKLWRKQKICILVSIFIFKWVYLYAFMDDLHWNSISLYHSKARIFYRCNSASHSTLIHFISLQTSLAVDVYQSSLSLSLCYFSLSFSLYHLLFFWLMSS